MIFLALYFKRLSPPILHCTSHGLSFPEVMVIAWLCSWGLKMHSSHYCTRVRLNPPAFCGGGGGGRSSMSRNMHNLFFLRAQKCFSDGQQYQNGFIECIPASLLTSQHPVTVHLFKETHWSLCGNYCFICVLLSHTLISSLINDTWNCF